MSNMPEFGDTGQDRTGEFAQPVEEDAIDADAREKADGVHAKHLRADGQSGQPRNLVIECLEEYQTSVRENMEPYQPCGLHVPFAMDEEGIVNQNTGCARGDELRNGCHWGNGLGR